MNLNEIPTPISEKIAYEATTRTVGKWVVPFAKCQDLERRLTVAREALANLERRATFGTLCPDRLSEARKALTLTAPKL